MDPITIGKGAITVAGILQGILGGKKSKGSIGAINNKFLNMPVTGALSAEDYAFADRSLGRAKGAIRSNVAAGTRGVLRRSTQRGVGGAALEQLLADVEAGGSVATEDAVGQNADLLHGIREGNKDRDLTKQLTAWGGEISDFQHERQVKAQKNASFWNSFSQFAPQMFSTLGSLPTANVQGIKNIAGTIPTPQPEFTNYSAGQ